MGLSLLLPSRKAMGLPQWFREQPFPDSTSLRKPIPGREPRAGSALPAPRSRSMGMVHLHMGEPSQLHPMQMKTLTATLAHSRTEIQGLDPPTPQSIFLPCTGKPLHPFTLPFTRNPFPSTLLPPYAQGETPSSPILICMRDTPLPSPLFHPQTHSLEDESQLLPLPGSQSPTPPEPAAPTPSHHPGGVVG